VVRYAWDFGDGSKAPIENILEVENINRQVLVYSGSRRLRLILTNQAGWVPRFRLLGELGNVSPIVGTEAFGV
jgi:hypothetical protein